MTYNNWRIGISREVLKFVLDLSCHDTDEANFLGKDIADERLVFTISRSFQSEPRKASEFTDPPGFGVTSGSFKWAATGRNSAHLTSEAGRGRI